MVGSCHRWLKGTMGPYSPPVPERTSLTSATLITQTSPPDFPSMQSCVHQLYEWGRILAVRTDPKTYHSPFWPWFQKDPTPEIMRQILEQQLPTEPAGEDNEEDEDEEQVPTPPPSPADSRIPTPEPPLFPSALFDRIEHTASGDEAVPSSQRGPAVEHGNKTSEAKEGQITGAKGLVESDDQDVTGSSASKGT
ncbi:hypothetical protein BC567DRAFT_42320 [Phyllosticta citribraziliensis]